MEKHEILNLREACIQDEPAFCTAECPLHVDMKAILSFVKNGEFDKAYKLYAKKVPFPEILGRICDHPCEKKCKRKEIDEAVHIGMIEKSILDYSKKKKKSNFYSIAKAERIAVIGGGLCGVSCAYDLAKKGYAVTIFDRNASIGGLLLEYDENILPKNMIEKDFDKLSEEKVTLIYDREISTLEDLNFDAYFIATGANGNDFGLKLETYNCTTNTKITLETKEPGVFLGGSILSDGKYSPVNIIDEGMRASRSIERYLKGLSTIIDRENELNRETKLYTNTEGYIKTKAIQAQMNDYYLENEAIEEAERCIECECMACVKDCIYLKNYKNYPKNYIKDIAKMLYGSSDIGTKDHMHQLNTCSMCGLCEKKCPNGVSMETVCRESKIQLQSDGDMPKAFHDFWLRDLEFCGSESFHLIKNEKGKEKSRYLFFPGCQTGASNPEYVTRVYDYLLKNLSEVGLYLECCGAPAEWSGNMALFNNKIKQIKKDVLDCGNPTLILTCPTCQKIFRKYLPELNIISIWDIVSEYGNTSINLVNNQSIAIYDPCSSRDEPEMQKTVRKLLTEAGYIIEELPLNGAFAQCCSYGGLITSIDPNLGEMIRKDRVNASKLDYVTYCTNCRDDFANAGKNTVHLIDVLFDFDMNDAWHRKPPTRTERRHNRKMIKSDVLEKYWGEKMLHEKKSYETIQLNISDKLKEKMDYELILEEEVQSVIEFCEREGIRAFDPQSGHYTAHQRIGIITYWIEYLPNGNQFDIYSVYSHRMQIVEVPDV